MLYFVHTHTHTVSSTDWYVTACVPFPSLSMFVPRRNSLTQPHEQLDIYDSNFVSDTRVPRVHYLKRVGVSSVIAARDPFERRRQVCVRDVVSRKTNAIL